MKILIESDGTFSKKETITIPLEINKIAIFEYLDENIVIKIDEVANENYTISTSHKFVVENDGVCNLLFAFNIFNIPLYDETILALPLYDGSYKLKFMTIKEMQ